MLFKNQVFREFYYFYDIMYIELIVLYERTIGMGNDMEELINNVKTKRYTYNRINRMLVHILCDFTKDEASNLKTIEYIRVLGFNDKGKQYLNSVKKNIGIPLITGYSDIKSNMLDLEYRVTSIYALKDNKVLELENRNKPIIK